MQYAKYIYTYQTGMVMRGVIAMVFALVLMNNVIADERIDNAVELGIITNNEAELIVNGVEDGTMDVIDVNADEGIMTFAVIYYEEEEQEETINVPCTNK
jgi:hypothetical protein